MSEAKPPAICIMGPTASGKTDLALQLAEHLPVEIISVDSALVYRGMDIGTCKPSLTERQRVPHHLIDILDPTAAYSAACFREQALQTMAEVVARQKIPLLVGGTMLYFRVLQEGLADLPDAQAGLREKLESRLKEQGLAALHHRLAGLDPTAAEQIHPNDPQRILRALEVIETTGKPISDLWQQQAATTLPYSLIKIALLPDERSLLHQRIAERFEQMLQQGFIDEVNVLFKRGDINADMPSMRAVGYRQVWQYLQGLLEKQQLLERGIIATRQLAKRQLTWLRSESDLEPFNCFEYRFPVVLDRIKQQLTSAGK